MPDLAAANRSVTTGPDYRQNGRGHLAETEIGDWTMPDLRKAQSYAASQGWLVVWDDGLTLTTAGLAAA